MRRAFAGPLASRRYLVCQASEDVKGAPRDLRFGVGVQGDWERRACSVN